MVVLMLIIPVFLVMVIIDSVVFPGNKMLDSMWNVQKSCHCHRLASSTRLHINVAYGYLEVVNAPGCLENIPGTLDVVLTPPGSYSLGNT